MNTEEKIEALVRAKSWLELNDEEKSFVQSVLGGEDVYENLRAIELNLSGTKQNLKPSAQVLDSLQQHFHTKHQRYGMIERLMAVRLSPIAAIVMLMVGIAGGWYIGSNNTSTPEIVYNEVLKTDTLFVASPPDTVFVPKLVYRRIYVEKQQQLTAKTEQQTQEEILQGVSMKDNELLNSVIVSGTE